jgi:hypothetical protein
VYSSTSSQTRWRVPIDNNVFLCPWRRSVAVPMRWVVNAQRRIGLNHLGLCRPTEKAAHGVKEMESLNWCRGAPISARARFWHKAGLPGAVSQCPLSGVKRTWVDALHMSAYDPKRTSTTPFRWAGVCQYDCLTLASGATMRRMG